ncbi:MarR family winged helix-turn-helix transcriptional regulator [Kitasatospora sp. MAP5-34]|uniref:MarR family winged helix-turn-helix transcriptional regulator n=1 Tax=Kitasatospora sp. MAP5-34 TaxID=3035102 RepID=UPI0024770A95|nr:MarR family winged helix-turn-helix transcriptional regulator [Kitasatospora sp. MAP5-34]MDH6577699.1 DNA-binding MarR family transcriptional regulator [Kitasatospora sp. MAP5-34]
METHAAPTAGADDRRPGEVPLLLAMAFRAMSDHLHSRLAELGREPLRPAHGYVFRYLADHPDATTVDLASHLGVTKQSASKTVTELAEWGYLQRHPHPTDRRAQVLRLTDRGREYLRLADQLWAEAEQRWADLIGPDRLAAIHHDLRAYLDHLHDGRPAKLRPVW